MARGKSGRLVIEISPELKSQLHSTLALEGTTMKAWFITTARNYLDGHAQTGTKTKDAMREKKK